MIADRVYLPHDGAGFVIEYCETKHIWFSNPGNGQCWAECVSPAGPGWEVARLAPADNPGATLWRRIRVYVAGGEA